MTSLLPVGTSAYFGLSTGHPIKAPRQDRAVAVYPRSSKMRDEGVQLISFSGDGLSRFPVLRCAGLQRVARRTGNAYERSRV